MNRKTRIPIKFENHTFRDYMFYKYLGLSPSYYLVHKAKTKAQKRDLDKKIPNLEKVKNTYSLFGDVYTRPFHKWWKESGYKFLGVKKNIKPILYKEDLSISPEENADRLIYMIKSKDRSLDNNQNVFSFIKNKMRDDTLEQRYEIIYRQEKISPHLVDFVKNGKISNWVSSYLNREIFPVSNKSKSFKNISRAFALGEGSTIIFESNSTETIDIPVKSLIGIKKNYRNKDTEKAKRYLSMLVSKNKREGLLIAENAARGDFPSIQKIDCLSFNDVSVFDLLYREDHFYDEEIMDIIEASNLSSFVAEQRDAIFSSLTINLPKNDSLFNSGSIKSDASSSKEGETINNKSSNKRIKKMFMKDVDRIKQESKLLEELNEDFNEKVEKRAKEIADERIKKFLLDKIKSTPPRP